MQYEVTVTLHIEAESEEQADIIDADYVIESIDWEEEDE